MIVKRTGLPYDMNVMEEIKENGAIVDMSDIKFPGIPADKVQRTTFIFFRNTGFDVKLDFSNCSFEEKEQFLIAYLLERIDVKQTEFATSYVKILNRAVGNDIDVECIMTNEEIDRFIENYKDDISDFLQFAVSLPLFAMYYFSLNNQAYDMSEFEHTDDDKFSDNFYHIISTDGFIALFDHDITLPPLFYDKLFTFENHKLLEAIQNLPFFAILHGLCTTSTEDWEAMLKTSNELNIIIEGGE